MSLRLWATSALALSAFLPDAAQACSACGCNLDTSEVAVGTPSPSSLSVDERVDYINQNQLWQGGGKAAGPLRDPTSPDQHEVQRNTRTLWYTTTVDYQSAGAWGITVAVPAQYRTHSTYGTQGTWEPSKSNWNALGDARVLGRYGLTDDKSFSVLAGLKLPTGGTTHNFDSGPSAGTLVDRGLQPGTGTWDVLLGLSQNGRITNDLAWFATELWQKPLEQHNGFAQGQTINGSIGVNYALSEMIVPQFQINAQNRWRDRGINADIANSGGEVIYASPGLFVNVRPDTALYGFVQLPVYQRVGGLELVPSYSASFGVKKRF